MDAAFDAGALRLVKASRWCAAPRADRRRSRSPRAPAAATPNRLRRASIGDVADDDGEMRLAFDGRPRNADVDGKDRRHRAPAGGVTIRRRKASAVRAPPSVWSSATRGRRRTSGNKVEHGPANGLARREPEHRFGGDVHDGDRSDSSTMMIASIAVLTIAAKRASVCARSTAVASSRSDHTRRSEPGDRRDAEQKQRLELQTLDHRRELRRFVGRVVDRPGQTARCDASRTSVAVRRSAARARRSCVPASLASEHSSGQRTAGRGRAHMMSVRQRTIEPLGTAITGDALWPRLGGAADALSERAVQIGRGRRWRHGPFRSLVRPRDRRPRC